MNTLRASLLRSAARTLNAPARPGQALRQTLHREAVAPRRSYSTTPNQDQVQVQFGRPFQDFALLLSRIARALLLAGLGMGSVAFLLFEGGHQYVEYNLMRRRNGSSGLSSLIEGTGKEDDAYEWDTELSFDLTSLARLGCCEGSGGTDRRLGMRARHAVRSAWMCANLGAGVAPGLFFSPAEQAAASVHQASASKHAAQISGGGGLVDNSMLYAEQYLLTAVDAAEEKGIRLPDIAAVRAGLAAPALVASVDPTALSLELALAAVRERQGTPRSLEAAAAGYQRIFNALEAQASSRARGHGNTIHLAHLATRIGTAYTDLGSRDRARAWLEQAVSLAGGQSYGILGQEGNVDVTHSPASEHPSGKSTSWWPFKGTSSDTAVPQIAVVPGDDAAAPVSASPASTRALVRALLAQSVLLVSTRTPGKTKLSRSELEEALRTQSLVLRLSTVAPAPPPTTSESRGAQLHRLHLELQHALASMYAAETAYALRSAGVREKEILAILPEQVTAPANLQAITSRKKGKSARPPSAQDGASLALLQSAQASAIHIQRALVGSASASKTSRAELSDTWAKQPGLSEIASALLVQSYRVLDAATETEEVLARLAA